MPSLKPVGDFLSRFTGKERPILSILLGLLATALIVWGVNAYANHTHLVPAVDGVYREGIIGGPRYINPVLAPLNEVDRDLSRIVYRGLMKTDSDGNIVPDLAEKYTVSNDHKTYEFTLKKGLVWQDNEPITADDIVFTFAAIQNQNYQSPLRQNWEGVTVEKVSELTTRFTLPSPYALFLENATLGILPRHIWQNVPANNFALADFNLKPVGDGPYRVKSIDKTAAGAIRSLTMTINERYGGKKPYIPTIVFQFYPDESSLLTAYRNNKIDGLNYVPALQVSDINSLKNIKIYSFPLPRYFAIFLNENKSLFQNATLRQALAYAIDRDHIIHDVLNNYASLVNSPLSPSTLYSTDQNVPEYAYDPAKAKSMIEGLKLKKPPQITLTTLNDKQLEAVANVIKQNWDAVGVTTTVAALDPLNLKENAIRQRDYEALLFGQALRYNPDPFSFWHSSQVKAPGLNIAIYKNSKVDTLLTDARTSFDESVRAQKYARFQSIVATDEPAIFLYSPDYLYAVRSNIKGISGKHLSSPEDRFNGITNWYIKTERVFGK